MGPVSGIQRLATLLVTHEVFLRPRSGEAPIDVVSALRPLTGERTVLPVVAEATAANGVRWLEVRLPGRPNGRKGWILERATVGSATTWSIVVHIDSRTMTIESHGRPVRTVKVVVGTPVTPTPRGVFFVEEVLRLAGSAVGAPYAFALSARSNVLKEFDGGPGQIALHGLGNIGGVPGTAASHGCVRVDTAALDWMVTRIGPGTPVTMDR